MARVLIAGCGYVGSALAERLVAEGHVVWGLRRDPAGLPPGVRPLAADLTDPGTLRNLPSGLECVVYTAAPDRLDDAAYRSIYVDGLS
ncbi:MAG: NAD-dependent epimerase/dehydratase family protein, partial [Candidatus Methylomirabilales bacterium]